MNNLIEGKLAIDLSQIDIEDIIESESFTKETKKTDIEKYIKERFDYGDLIETLAYDNSVNETHIYANRKIIIEQIVNNIVAMIEQTNDFQKYLEDSDLYQILKDLLSKSKNTIGWANGCYAINQYYKKCIDKIDFELYGQDDED